MERVTEGKKLRLFVAVDVPRELLAALEASTQDLRTRWPAARWVPIDNQHITLKFLGWVEPVRSADVVAAVEAVARRHEPAVVRTGVVGVFPTRRRARVLWVGLQDASGQLASLAADLEATLEPLGFRRERRDFTPHLTLARWPTPRSVIDEPAIGRVPIEAPFDVDRMVLYRSHLSPKGPRYEALVTPTLGSVRGGADPYPENQ